MTQEELNLFYNVVLPLMEDPLQLVKSITFSASFISSDWIGRLDYKAKGNDDVLSVLIEGSADKIYSFQHVAARKFLIRPSIIQLEEGVFKEEVNGPDLFDSRPE
jgi:hypothetical protein